MPSLAHTLGRIANLFNLVAGVASPNFSLGPIGQFSLPSNFAIATANSFTKIPISTVSYDNAGAWSTASTRYVCKKAGIYKVSGFANFSGTYSSVGSVFCSIFKNGANWSQCQFGTAFNGAFGLTLTPNALISLAVGDYIELYADSQFTGVTVAAGATLELFWISP